MLVILDKVSIFQKKFYPIEDQLKEKLPVQMYKYFDFLLYLMIKILKQKKNCTDQSYLLNIWKIWLIFQDNSIKRRELISGEYLKETLEMCHELYV